MNEQNNRKNTRKNPSFAIWVLVLILIGLFNSEDSGLGVYVLAVILLVAAFVYLLRALTRKAGSRDTGADASQRARPAAKPGPTRRTPAKAISTHREFPAPDARKIIREYSGEDHFARDKAKRLRQLDDWLKNGLIERDEYRVLKARYERDT